ncbi:MAG: leucine-rich repeat domain-containing protein [Eubacterium sp.]|nr:leucine-rich repeat domain-containing protein [Eubacterium sp.]
MRTKKIWNAVWTFVFCLASLIVFTEKAHAAETDSQRAGTLRAYIENQGLFYGEYKDCMYTYTNQEKEIKIIGLNENAENIKIPNKINGKKVTILDLIPKNEVISLGGSLNLKAKSITLSRYMNKITDSFFYYFDITPKLEAYHVSSDNPKFMAKDGVLFSKHGRTLISFPEHKKMKTYQIPSGVTKIASYAFKDCRKVQNIVMPDTVKIIKHRAFCDSSIHKINLSRNLEMMEESAFEGSDITEITIPSKLKEIPKSCFCYCKKLKKVTIQQGVKKIVYHAFLDCPKLRTIIIPPSVTDFDEGAFVYISSHFKPEIINLTIYAKERSFAYKEASKWGEHGIKVKKWNS